MKYPGSILDFTHQRNDELLRAFREQLALADYVVMPEIFEKVANSPTRRFWVSEERAAIVISAMLSGKPLPRMLPTKREMFEEIFRRFIKCRKAHPGISLADAIAIVVHSPAPKFYLTPRTAGEIIYRIKKGWYDSIQYDRYRDCTDENPC